MVFDGDVVQLVIVNSKVEGAIWLFDERNRGSKVRLGRANETLGNHAVDIVFEGFELGF